MAALDFPASPTLNQLATLTNGFTYQWDGAVWTLAAATGQQAGGDLTGTYPNPLIGPGAVGNAEISDVAYGKITGAPVALPPSGAAGGDLSGTYPAPVVAKASGGFTVAGQVTAGGSVTSGISQGAAALNAGGAGNTGFLSWLNAAGTRCGYMGFGGGTRQSLVCNENGYTGIDVAGTLGATLVDNSVTRTMIAAGSTTNQQSAVIPANYTVSPAATWVKLVDVPSLTLRGGRVLISLVLGARYVGSNTAQANYIGWGKGGAVAVGLRMDFSASGSGFTTWPIAGASWWDNPGAVGATTYSIWAFVGGGSGNIITSADAAGYVMVTEFT